MKLFLSILTLIPLAYAQTPDDNQYLVHFGSSVLNVKQSRILNYGGYTMVKKGTDANDARSSVRVLSSNGPASALSFSLLQAKGNTAPALARHSCDVWDEM